MQADLIVKTLVAEVVAEDDATGETPVVQDSPPETESEDTIDRHQLEESASEPEADGDTDDIDATPADHASELEADDDTDETDATPADDAESEPEADESGEAPEDDTSELEADDTEADDTEADDTEADDTEEDDAIDEAGEEDIPPEPEEDDVEADVEAEDVEEYVEEYVEEDDLVDTEPEFDDDDTVDRIPVVRDTPAEVPRQFTPPTPPTPPKPRSWGRNVTLGVVFLAVLATPVASVAYMADTQQWDAPAAASTVAPGVFATPEPPTLEPPVTQDAPPDPSAQCLANVLQSVHAANGQFTGQVRSVNTGAVLWSRNAGKPQMPASNQKVLTALALVDALGPDALDTTFKTSVVSTAPDKIILVGGGDPYLASSRSRAKVNQPTTLADLATITAEALLAADQKTVSLGFDESLFKGPSWNPLWEGRYDAEVSPISALWTDQGHTKNPNGIGSKTPALDAARLFAKQLGSRGVTVSSVATKGSSAPADAPVLASIESLPLRKIASQALLYSENSTTEVLFRHISAASGKGSFVDSAQAMTDWLKRIKVDAPGLRVADGCGLSRKNAIPASVLAGAIAWAGATDGPAREVLTLMPVAGVSGSLQKRFAIAGTGPGRGWVRAKTGTLNDVSSLSGYTVTRKGQVLAFSFLVNDGAVGYWARITWLDQMAAKLTTTSC